MPQPAPIAVPMEALLADSIEPLVVGVLLAGGVGLGLPCGALVVLAGALFGSAVGLLTVVLAQAIGLSINWHLCRGVLRPCLEGRLQRPALIPMALVNAACALSPTAPRRYALACVVLLPRFALMVFAGDLGAAALRGSLSPVALALRLLAQAPQFPRRQEPLVALERSLGRP